MARFFPRTLIVAFVAAVLVVSSGVVAAATQQSGTVLERSGATTPTPVANTASPTPTTTPTAPATAPGTIELVDATEPVLRGDPFVLAGRFEDAALRTFVVQRAKQSTTDWTTLEGSEGTTTESGDFRVTLTAGLTRSYRVVLSATTSGDPERVTPALTVSTTKGWRQISTSVGHTCGIWYDNTLWCWGMNYYGQLGNKTNIGTVTPNPVPARVRIPGSDQTWLTVAAAFTHTCGLLSDRTLWCWGDNRAGQLGNAINTGIYGPNPTPTRVQAEGADQTWLSIDVAPRSTCGIRSDHTLWCWGLAAVEADSAADEPNFTPTQVQAEGADQTWLSVATGLIRTCGIRSDHTLWCWGWNSFGQLGPTNAGTKRQLMTPTQLLAEGDDQAWLSVEGARLYTCGTRSDQTLWCWGSNRRGQLGNEEDIGTFEPNPDPTQIRAKGTDQTWLSVEGGYSHVCGIRANHTLWCWGYNLRGQLGSQTNIGTHEPNPDPTKVHAKGEDQTWLALAAAGHHTCGIRADHTLWCWGQSRFAQFGTYEPIPAPFEIPDPRG